MPKFSVEFKLFYPDRGLGHQLVKIDLQSQTEDMFYPEATIAIDKFMSNPEVIEYLQSEICFSRYNISDAVISNKYNLVKEIGKAKIYEYIVGEEI